MKWNGITIDTSNLKNTDGTSIESRLSSIERSSGGGGGIGTHFNFPMQDGGVYINGTHGNQIGVQNSATNLIQGVVLSTAQNVQIQDFTIYLGGNNAAGKLCKIAIYQSTNRFNWNLIGNSSDIDCSSNGLKTWNDAFINFETGYFYAICIITNGVLTFYAHQQYLYPIFASSANGKGQTGAAALTSNVGSFSLPQTITSNMSNGPALWMAWMTAFKI